MMKQTVLALLLSSVMVISVPAISSEPLTTPVAEGVEAAAPTLKDRIGGVYSSVKENAIDLKDGLFSGDERLQRAQAQIDTQKQIIAELQYELTNLRIKTDVEHIQMIQASEHVTAYLKSLIVE